MIREFQTRLDTDTRTLAENFGRRLTGKTHIALTGDLGAGKTTFVQGLAKGLDVPDSYYVTSPTYNIISEYPGRIPLFHVDLYRISDEEELEMTGFYEYIHHEAAVAVEWPEMADTGLVPFDFRIHLELIAQKNASNFQRRISIIASGRSRYNLVEDLLL